ncbi:MAG TPA: response regulator [Verrucomicrobiae bacterium]
MTDGTKDGSKTAILLIDDSKAGAAQIVNLFRSARVTNPVHVLTEGRDVLDFLFRKGRFEQDAPLLAETLILLSLQLQSAIPAEVLKKIKSDERSRSFPIIVLTSSQQDRGVMEAYKLGANAAIVHPIDITKFMEAIAELKLGWLLISSEER